MKKKTIIILFAVVVGFNAHAQFGEFLQGEFGFTAGVSNYFGDLNPSSSFSHPKPAVGIFYLKQFNNYLGMRVSAHYTQLGYSDIYNNNSFQRLRNLSFNTDIWELAVHGDFNFFKFVPGDDKYFFTPFISIGAGIFTYDPYAYVQGRKVYLRPLGTEGQNINYKDAEGNVRSPYGSMAFCFPVGIGIKYNISNRTNLSFQITHRLTNTDYIDDVSTTYVGADKFPTLPNGQPSDAGLLQDRSYNYGTPIGVEGRQRGWSKQKDQYIIAEIGLSFTFSDYRCPSAEY
ncbi:type IX secretion system protein PorG [Ferruginibacter albus]|uniref:type IX secretion system protein PorG n=1 Tax=Ferruginibacter albus TaxID=2875540 RepID=UPI001CC67F25|nr:DUF6089 family protein [Ferruginibacter albus]UAY51836.1 DUF6089 family protein [Ferruginibacter albus]